MFVDILLRMLGDDPTQYQDPTEVKVALFGIIIEKFLWILPFILFVLPFFFLWRRKKKGISVTKKRIVITLFVSVILLIIGFMMSDWYDYLIAVIGIRSYYGM